jgi:hypothetical protein
MTTKQRPPVRPEGKTFSYAWLMQADLPTRDHILSPWLRQGESALIWAAPGVGKSMLALTIAMAVAGGGKALGWSCDHPRRVWVVDGEMPVDDLRDRLKMLTPAVEDIDKQALGKNLKVLARHYQDHRRPFLDLSDETHHVALVNTLIRDKVEVVVLDNLSTLAAVEDENDAAKMRTVVNLLVRLKQANIATVVVHHANKGGRNYRGSTMLSTTFEAELGLLRDEGQDLVDTSGSARFRIEWRKFRGKRDASVRDCSVQLEEGPDGARWVVQATQGDVSEAIAAMVRTGTYGTQKEVLEALPSHLWPDPSTRPSKQWMSKQMGLLNAKHILRSNEANELFNVARETPYAGAEADPHDDI